MKILYYIVICFLLILFNQPSKAADNTYGYGENDGPDTWAEKFEHCGGDRQTPVNIDDTQTYPGNFTNTFKFKNYINNHKRKLFKIINNGNTVSIRLKKDTPSISGGPLNSIYELGHIHFHWGSEHTFNGKNYGLEAHLVHYKRQYKSVSLAKEHSDGLAVVALLFQTVYYDNEELSKFTKKLSEIREKGSSNTYYDSSMHWLEKYLNSNHYYTYQGSLSVPPCNEVVTWIVLKYPATIGVHQIEELQKLENHHGPMITTSRPIQPLNNRLIYYFDLERDMYTNF